MTPAASSAASVTRASPASDPEWATAAACAWSLRPTLTAMIGLPSSSARSARARNRSGRLKPSTNRMTELRLRVVEAVGEVVADVEDDLGAAADDPGEADPRARSG